MELTEQDREKIKKEIAEYKKNLPVVSTEVPKLTPIGTDASADFNQALSKEMDPNKREAKVLKRRFHKLWVDWRNNELSEKDLLNYKRYCTIELERAETDAKLDDIKYKKQLAKMQHWLKMNEGNLKEVGYNTECYPSKVAYRIRRGFFYITSWTDSVPKIVKNLFWIGIIVAGVFLVKRFL